MEEKSQLIKFLNLKGFVGEKLEADVKRQQELFNPVFKISHFMQFGENSVAYELNFIYDRQFSAYRLTSYIATLQEVMIIGHKVVNEIDTAALERDMRAIDWNRHFFEKQTLSDPELISAEQALNQLDNLAEMRDFDANQISEQLQFKYFPPDIYAEVAIEDYSQLYQPKREFIASEFGIENARLAYHILCGNLDSLHHSLHLMGIEPYLQTDLTSLLAADLSSNPDEFIIYGTGQNDKGLLDLEIKITKNANTFQVDTLNVDFTPFPEFSHFKAPDLDTLLLEEQLKKINWEEDKLISIDDNDDDDNEDNEDLLPHINEIKDKVYRLYDYPDGKAVADYLKMRYWSHSVEMEVYFDDPMFEQWKEHHKVSQEFSVDINISAAVNIVLGKPVLAKPLEKIGENFNQWFIIDPSTKASNGLNPLELVDGLSIKEVEIMLRMLPLSGSVDVSSALYSLSRGERIQVDLVGLDGEQIVHVETNPKEKTIDVFAEDGGKIPFNFRLDNVWKPTISEDLLINTKENLKQPIQEQSRTKQLHQKRYGRGL